MFQCLPRSVWASGNLAELARQLGNLVAHPNQSKPTPLSRTRWYILYISSESHSNALRVGKYFLPSIGCLVSPGPGPSEVAAAASELPVLLLLLLSVITQEEEGLQRSEAAAVTDLCGLRFWLKWRTKKLPAARAGPLADRSDD